MLLEVLEQDESNPLALYNLAVVQRDNQNYDDALDTLKTYLKTAKGKPGDSEQVFALIDDIHKNQVEKGQSVSDDDIQAMALAARDSPDKEERKKTKVATAEKPRKAATPLPKAKVKAAPAQKSVAAPALNLPEDDGGAASDDDEMSELEKTLTH